MRDGREDERTLCTFTGNVEFSAIRLRRGGRKRVHANPSDAFARVISAGHTRLNYTRRHKPALNHCRNLRDLRRPGAVPGNGLRRSISIA